VRNYAASTLLNVDDVRNANRIYQRREVRKQSNRHDDPRHAVLLTALVTARLRLWLCGRCPSERIKRRRKKTAASSSPLLDEKADTVYFTMRQSELLLYFTVQYYSF